MFFVIWGISNSRKANSACPFCRLKLVTSFSFEVKGCRGRVWRMTWGPTRDVTLLKTDPGLDGTTLGLWHTWCRRSESKPSEAIWSPWGLVCHSMNHGSGPPVARVHPFLNSSARLCNITSWPGNLTLLYSKMNPNKINPNKTHR